MSGYTDQLIEIFEESRERRLLSTLLPSEWAEKNRVMTSDETPWPGPFSFSKAPYMREPLDRLSPKDPARKIALMCGSQLGKTRNIIENGICWIISENPGNILFLTGHTDLSEEAIEQLDIAIDNCGIRPLIRPSTIRKKNSKTGDTSSKKEFAGGKLVSGSASNHKMLRQRSVRFIFADDLEAAKKSSKASGNTVKLIDQRAFAYKDVGKTFYISTPEEEENSNIHPVFKLGDQRYYFVKCPCCGHKIVLHWSTDLEGTDGNEKAGITWKLDDDNKLIIDSIGYICQKCGDFFDESHKIDMNLAGEWIATAEPSETGFYSYHVSALYAPTGACGWEDLVREYLQACPPGEEVKEDLLQTFKNLKLGLTYTKIGAAPEAKTLQKNIRTYEIGIIPEKLSLQDGNGRIVLLTCACDCNGTEKDARLDYEIVAWSEAGASYSVAHGSIGTFQPGEGKKKERIDREHWSYEPRTFKNVWGELEKIISKIYMTDSPNPTPEEPWRVGRKMKIGIVGVDYGHFTQHVYDFIDNNHATVQVVGIRGDKENRFRKYDADTASFKPAKERAGLYLIDVNYVKDNLAEYMKMKWNGITDPQQPPSFMNYPIPANGLYLLNNFFSHYESEHKTKVEKDGVVSFRWVKRGSTVQNHFFDVRVYGIALRDIIIDTVCKEFDIKRGTWADFCRIMLRK